MVGTVNRPEDSPNKIGRLRTMVRNFLKYIHFPRVIGDYPPRLDWQKNGLPDIPFRVIFLTHATVALGTNWAHVTLTHSILVQ